MHYIRRFSILSYFYGSFQFWDTFRALFLFLASPNIPLTFDFTHSSSSIKTILDHSFRINKWLTQPIVVIVQTTILNIEKKKKLIKKKMKGFFHNKSLSNSANYPVVRLQTTACPLSFTERNTAEWGYCRWWLGWRIGMHRLRTHITVTQPFLSGKSL